MISTIIMTSIVYNTMSCNRESHDPSSTRSGTAHYYGSQHAPHTTCQDRCPGSSMPAA